MHSIRRVLLPSITAHAAGLRGLLAVLLVLTTASLGAAPPTDGASPSADAAAHGPQLAYSTADAALDLEPLDVHPRTLLTIVDQLRHNHFLEQRLDDQLSSEIFDNYLDMLDGARVYFTAADVAELEKYRHELDDALVRGNLEPAFEI